MNLIQSESWKSLLNRQRWRRHCRRSCCVSQNDTSAVRLGWVVFVGKTAGMQSVAVAIPARIDGTVTIVALVFTCVCSMASGSCLTQTEVCTYAHMRMGNVRMPAACKKMSSFWPCCELDVRWPKRWVSMGPDALPRRPHVAALVKCMREQTSHRSALTLFFSP